MRENKGFTLIELLAVIVILAIIALIATPVILGIIEDARASANERSAELIKSGIQNAYTSWMMANNGSEPSGLSDFITEKFYTVDSTSIKNATDSNNDGVKECGSPCQIETNEGSIVTCTVTYASQKVGIECTGTFPDSVKTKTYEFSAKVSQ